MEIEALFKSYLENKMNDADRVLFEKLLDENPDYRAQLEDFQKEWKKNQDPSNIKTLPKSALTTKSNSFKTWGISIAIALTLVVSGYFLLQALIMSPGEKLFLSSYSPSPTMTAGIQVDNPLITEAIQLYQNKNYDQAVELLEELAAQHKSDLVYFYLGLSQLGIERPEKAIPALDLVSEQADFFPEAKWYMALGYLKLDKLEEAKNHLLVAAGLPNPHAEKAKEILQKMK